jgi:hypothetical protein
MRKISLLPLRMLLVNFLVLFSLTGCAVKQMKATETGFLSGYSGLEENEELKGLRVYKNPDVNISERYSKVLIAPIQFKLDPTIKEHEMKFEDRLKLSEYFHERLAENLSKNYEITDEPGKDVLLFRAAVTDVLPNKVYLNLHWSTTLIGGGIGGASLEAEVVDSLTNERVLSFVDARKGKKLNYTKGLTKWGHTKEVLGMWADIMVENLNRLRDEYTDGTMADPIEGGV